jgi:hypothetical protein
VSIKINGKANGEEFDYVFIDEASTTPEETNAIYDSIVNDAKKRLNGVDDYGIHSPEPNRIKVETEWFHRSYGFPDDGRRIWVFSPQYKKDDPMRVRIMDSQFYGIVTDGDWWAYVKEPEVGR